MRVFKFYLFIFFIFFLIFNKAFSQVVWKSDGTIIGSDGEVKTESYGARFQKQLLNPTDDWPKATGEGEGIQQNYFGNDIFIPGTPLLRMSGIDFGSDYTKKLAELNLFKDAKEMQKFILGNANNKFLKDIDVSENEAIQFISKINLDDIPLEQKNIKQLISEKEMQIKLNKNVINKVSSEVDNKVRNKVTKKLEGQVKEEVKNKVEEKVQEQVQQQVEEKVQEQVQEQVEEKVQEKVQEQVEQKIQNNLNDYFDKLEEQYKSMGWVICDKSEGFLSASPSAAGCG